MPDTDRPELLGARPIGRSERIPVTRHVDRTWRIAQWAIHLGEIFDFSRLESRKRFGMLLSFERPACWPAAQRISIPGPAGDRANLFADLENCTVANVLGIRVIA
jgi:hypothetical protein